MPVEVRVSGVVGVESVLVLAAVFDAVVFLQSSVHKKKKRVRSEKRREGKEQETGTYL